MRRDDRYDETMMSWLDGTLEPEAERELEARLAVDETAAAEARELRELWLRMGLVADEAPSDQLRERFDAHLESYRSGLESAEVRPPLVEGVIAWVDSWWPRRPALRLAYTLAVLVAGVTLGSLTGRGEAADRAELATLQGEVQSLSGLVALSLLRQDSASDRILGASYTQRLEQPDSRVTTALVEALSKDPNVNVRLAAVDALASSATNPLVLRRLTDALGEQESPMVQIRLAQLLLAADGAEARHAVRTILDSRELEDTVRACLEQSLAEEGDQA